jgi:hypothetical protein
MLLYSLIYSCTLKIEATYSPEKSVYFQRTTRRYILEDRIILNDGCFKSRLLCLNVKLDEIIILPEVLYGRETWSPTLREVHRHSELDIEEDIWTGKI